MILLEARHHVGQQKVNLQGGHGKRTSWLPAYLKESSLAKSWFASDIPINDILKVTLREGSKSKRVCLLSGDPKMGRVFILVPPPNKKT